MRAWRVALAACISAQSGSALRARYRWPMIGGIGRSSWSVQMTTSEATTEAVLPERLSGQGLDEHQYESGDRAIRVLLTDPTVGPQTDLVITYRDGAYEVWAQRGMIRFQRFYARRGGGYEYRVIEQIGENPIANQDRKALATIDEELAASKASGFTGHRREHGVRRAGAHHLPVRVRAHRAALRQPERARPRRQPEGVRLRPPAGPARRARRHPGALAAGLLRPGHQARRR